MWYKLTGIYVGSDLVRPPIPDVPYLCLTANTAGSTVQLVKNWTPTDVTLETSTDKRNWSTYTMGDTITLSSIWDSVYWRNTSETDTGFSWTGYSTSGTNYYNFVMTGSIAASWDTNYLLNKNSTTTASWGFSRLFRGCTSLTSAPTLPSTTLKDYCYAYMFSWCTGLTTPPALPATTLNSYCYVGMFYTCSWLTTVPELPATTLASNCYEYMFYDCDALEALPRLPATTIPWSAYARMFQSSYKIKLSTTQTWDYQTAYRIPTTWTWSTSSNALYYMFQGTGGTYTGTPSVNTTYYTSNTLV